MVVVRSNCSRIVVVTAALATPNPTTRRDGITSKILINIGGLHSKIWQSTRSAVADKKCALFSCRYLPNCYFLLLRVSFFAAQQTILLLNCKSLISIPFLQPCAIEMFTNKQLTFLLDVKRYQKQTQSRRKSFEKSKLK